MEPITTLLLLEIFLVSAINSFEKQRRKRILIRWLKGSLSMKELLWLKKQKWFQKGFSPANVSEEKKNA